jgi:hypothetical protein
MKKTRKMKSTSAIAKKRVAPSAKKPTRSAALMAKQHRKQSATLKRKAVVRTPPVTAAPEGRRSMPFLFWLVLPLTMMSMWWGSREVRNGA